MKLSSQFICELGTYHQETKVTYCSWLGQKRSHTSFSATLTSRRSQQHGGPTRLIRGSLSLKKNLDLVGRNDGHHRAQHGCPTSWVEVCELVRDDVSHRTARSRDYGMHRATVLRSPLKEGRKACLWIHGVSPQRPAS